MHNSSLIFYQTENGNTKLEVRLEDETVWLSQDQMAELFDKGRSTIAEHIANIFKEEELDEEVVCRNFRHTTQHGAITGKTQEKLVKHYNLDVIISVGYRVKSLRGTQFRIWATGRLKEYIIKGFAIDDERLKNNNKGNYFKELLERIRDIRSSEKVFYQQLKIFIQPVLITIQTAKSPNNFLLWYKTNYYLQSAEKLLLKLFTVAVMQLSQISG